MRKRYSRSYTVLSFLTMFSYRELPYGALFFLKFDLSTLIPTIMILHGRVIILLGVQCKAIGMGSYQNLSDIGEIL